MTFSYLVQFVSSHLVQLTITIGLVLLISMVTHRRWPRFTFLLCVLGLAKCLVPPLLTSPIGFFTLHESLTHRPVNEAGVTANPLTDRDTAGTQQTAFVNRNTPADNEFSGRAPSNVAGSGFMPTSIGERGAVWQAFGIVWLTGMVFLGSLAYGRWRSLKLALRHNHRAVPPEIEKAVEEIREQLRLKTYVRTVVIGDDWGPAVVGVMRPVLLLPESLVGDHINVVRPVIAHELSHIRRMDTLWGMFQFAAQVIWWFHPAVWLMSRRTTDVCERCCDADVLERLGFTPSTYAASLVRVMQLRQRASVVPVLGQMSAQGITAQRLQDLQRYQPSRAIVASMRWGMAALLAVMVIPGAAWLDAASALQAHEVQAYAEKRDRSAPISPFAVRTALENEDWRTSARLLQEIVAGNEHDGKAWFFLGFSLHKAGRLHEAIEAHARAAQFDEVRQTALYNWGCALALLNQTEKAIEKLTEAADCGFVDCADIATDSDLDSLHRHPKFDELRQRMSGASELQQAQKLDFLIGSWDVLNNDGKQTAKMTFRKQSNGFLIVEKRTDLSVVDDPGSAVSCLDPTGKVQKHTRIDANNRVFEYTGDATGGAIQMTGTVMHRNGECLLSRLKLELKANDLVVQRVSEADCDTANWTIQFTGTFRRCMEDG